MQEGERCDINTPVVWAGELFSFHISSGHALLISAFEKTGNSDKESAVNCQPPVAEPSGYTSVVGLMPCSSWGASSQQLSTKWVLRPCHVCPTWGSSNREVCSPSQLPIGLAKTLSDLPAALTFPLPNFHSSLPKLSQVSDQHQVLTAVPAQFCIPLLLFLTGIIPQ